MPSEAVNKGAAKPETRNSTPTLSKEITEKLLRRIMDGTYAPGSRLPPERMLAEEFGVTRLVVREALKRIETLGLLNIIRGSGAHVEDVETHGGIELIDLILFDEDSAINLKVLRDIVEFHGSTVSYAMGAAARRIKPEDLVRLKELVATRSALKEQGQDIVPVTLEISRSIVEATDNVYIHLLFNSVLRMAEGFRNLFELPARVDDLFGVQEFFERLMDAFEAGDSDMARLLTKRMFEKVMNAAFIDEWDRS